MFISLFGVSLYAYTFSGVNQGYIDLGKGLRISRVSKDHWLKGKVLSEMPQQRGEEAFEESQVLAEQVS